MSLNTNNDEPQTKPLVWTHTLVDNLDLKCVDGSDGGENRQTWQKDNINHIHTV